MARRTDARKPAARKPATGKPAARKRKPAKTWGGRFRQATHPLAEAYTLSLSIDRRLWREEIAASVAHARMLGRQRIIPRAAAAAIVRGLQEIRQEMADGRFPWRDELEDVHSNVEARLAEKIGAAAGRLHTARSRNDQVATDLRLYAKRACVRADATIRALQRALLSLAEANRRAVMPGYTHLQRAQPVLLAHHLLAYLEMLGRDVERFADAHRRADVLPLGSGALAGVPYPIDREAVADELGFTRLSENSIDAVSDRDFVVDFTAAAALCMTHLSRLAEEIVLWSSAEFGFLRLPDAFATGSSIMPQKRNPDVAELARARTGRVHGQLLSILTMLKALPLAYNRDLQEDKRAFFEAEDTLLETLTVFAAMIPELRFDAGRGRRAATENDALATDLADALVRRGLPFRRAHDVVGRLVRYAEERGKPFSRLSAAQQRRFSPLLPEAVSKLDLASALRARDALGGTAPRRVAAELRKWRTRLAQRRWRADLTTRPVHLDVRSRNPSPDDSEPLGSLMFAAYRSTIDEQHRSAAEAVAHVAKIFAGETGNPLLDCSFVALEDDRPISVTLVSMLDGAPFLNQVYTAPERQNRGLAGALIQLSMNALAAKGLPTLDLVTNMGNSPAEHLYRKLGFLPVEEAR